ncbi:MAG TPA: hypothetical protein VGZ23_12485 [bacterium]|nr:hypothetical protein [bacterium]
MLDIQLPAWMVEATMQLYAINKASAAAGVTQVVPQLLGRPARRFHEFARDHAAAWRV